MHWCDKRIIDLDDELPIVVQAMQARAGQTQSHREPPIAGGRPCREPRARPHTGRPRCGSTPNGSAGEGGARQNRRGTSGRRRSLRSANRQPWSLDQREAYRNDSNEARPGQ